MTIKGLAAGAALAVWAAGGGAAGALAQDRPVHLTEFKAYSDALAAGDENAAATHAEAAWRAAEEELGDHETTAILAENVVFEVIWTDPDTARPAAARALALRQAGHAGGSLTPAEIEVADAYLSAIEKPRSKERRARLEAAIAADRATGRDLGAFAVQTSQNGALVLAQAGDHERAYLVATGLAGELARMEGAPPALLAVADLQRLVSMIAEGKWRAGLGGNRATIRPDWEDRLRDARVLVEHAAGRFEPQAGIEAVDPNLAAAHAWRSVILALQATHHIDMPEGWTFEGAGLPERGPLIAGQMPVGACPIAWTKRKLTYPAGAQRRGFVGGVLLGYHLTEDGRVEGARILGEVPADRFGDKILAQVEKWRANTDGLDPRCMKDQVVSVQFVPRT